MRHRANRSAESGFSADSSARPTISTRWVRSKLSGSSAANGETAAGYPPAALGSQRTGSHPEAEVFFSAASLWEITIKRAIGRRDFLVDPRVLRRALVDNDYGELPITSEHVVHVDQLPPKHKDPFDRVLVAQAIVEGIMLLTNDQKLLGYPGPIQRV